MADKRFVETMSGGTKAAPVKRQHAGVVRVVTLDKYTRPDRDTIDAPEPKRRSYDSI